KNPIYAGMIQVPAYYDETAHMVKGLQEPIITEEDWWKVQAQLSKPPKKQVKLSEDLPLRGVLRCAQCGKLLTGGASKGKFKYYNYYWCVDHRKDNFSAIKVHKQLDQLVKALSLPEHYLGYLQESAERQLEETLLMSKA